MRISRRYAIILAVAAAGALVVAGVAVAGTASNGNVTSIGASFSPNKVPKKEYKAGKVKFNSSTKFANPGVASEGGKTHRLQVWFDNDLKVNPKAVAKCNPAKISGNITMAVAMNACSKAKVGTGFYESYNGTNPSHPVPACALLFNGTPKNKKPTLLVFARAQAGGATPTISCKDPAHNTQGNVSVLLTGVYKSAKGDLGTQLDVNNIDSSSPLALTADTNTLKKGNYWSARCKDKNKTWNFQVRHTYSDGVKVTDKTSQKCKVG